jgi:23S rRNA (cytidine1920-2'-O)/16S rRNA (cytidine1409-2'-O)-methyltransferase
MAKKERIDVLLVDQGFYETREKAKSAIMAGLVFINDERVDKPGTKVETESAIRVNGNVHPYVSRGGLKLEKAIQAFSLDFTDKIVIDIGASTGGFTDCALQSGAKLVYAVDVGYGQLAWTLRQDPRVVVMERTNFRYLTLSDLKGDIPNVAVIDVSFISLRIILPALQSLLADQGWVVTLIKPQFEAGREKIGKNGIVRDPVTHKQVLDQVLSFAMNNGFIVKDLTFSPITGGEGNIEFLAFLQKGQADLTTASLLPWIDKVVEDAHTSLLKSAK